MACWHNIFLLLFQLHKSYLSSERIKRLIERCDPQHVKVMLHGTTCNNDFSRNTASTFRATSYKTYLATCMLHETISSATSTHSKVRARVQAMLNRILGRCCAKNRRLSKYSSPCVASFWLGFKNSQRVAESKGKLRAKPSSLVHSSTFSFPISFSFARLKTHPYRVSLNLKQNIMSTNMAKKCFKSIK